MASTTSGTNSALASELVRVTLRSRGWQGKDLAVMLGVSPSTVSQAIARKRMSQNSRTLARISKLLGFGEDFLSRVVRGEDHAVAEASRRLSQLRGTPRRSTPEPAGSLPRPGPSVGQRSIAEKQRIERSRRTATQRLADMERRIEDLERALARLSQQHAA